jgi:serine/threonine protein kinase
MTRGLPRPLVPREIGPYKIRGGIGQGAFSVVHLSTRLPDSTYYACKIIDKNQLALKNGHVRFEQEIRFNQQLRHPGIVAVADLLQDAHNYYLFMEFCPGGELFQYVVDRVKLREQEAKSIFLQILTAVSYIHSFHIFHRDLKLENILLDSTGRIKIGDFGLSKFADDGLLRTPCGSPCYVAPECLVNKPYDGRTSDLWSCGVILYAMVTGELPWTKRNQQDLFNQIKRGEFTIPSFVSGVCRDLIKRLLTVDVGARISLEEATNHPFFADAARPVALGNPPFLSVKTVDAIFRPDPEENLRSEMDRSLTARELGFDDCFRMVCAERFGDRLGLQIEPRQKRPHGPVLSYLVPPKRLIADGRDSGRPMSLKRLTVERRDPRREMLSVRLKGDGREGRTPASPASPGNPGAGRREIARPETRTSLVGVRFRRTNV